jgi:hypothetical protein
MTFFSISQEEIFIILVSGAKGQMGKMGEWGIIPSAGEDACLSE